jgi:hypothetical protein
VRFVDNFKEKLEFEIVLFMRLKKIELLDSELKINFGKKD